MQCIHKLSHTLLGLTCVFSQLYHALSSPPPDTALANAHLKVDSRTGQAHVSCTVSLGVSTSPLPPSGTPPLLMKPKFEFTLSVTSDNTILSYYIGGQLRCHPFIKAVLLFPIVRQLIFFNLIIEFYYYMCCQILFNQPKSTSSIY